MQMHRRGEGVAAVAGKANDLPPSDMIACFMIRIAVEMCIIAQPVVVAENPQRVAS